MQVNKVTESVLPTPWGDFKIVGFEEEDKKQDHVALIYGNIYNKDSVLSRIHSECLTGDALFSLRCDCGFQLQAALIMIAKEGSGVLIYHRQEGRNIGLLNKLKAYSLQDQGFDTVEANHKLGFSADERDFTSCVKIFNILGIKNIRLLSNNPSKINVLKKYGMNIIKRISLVVGRNPKNNKYLDTKENKMGHVFSHNKK